MKGKLNGASQTKKRGFISVLMILLAFVANLVGNVRTTSALNTAGK